MKLRKDKIIIILTVFIDVVGLGIIIPILPYYVENFGVSSFVVTALFSTFAVFSFISGPFLGALSDRIGRRPIMIVSIASSAIGWFVFAGAHSVFMLFLGRIIDGMAAGNFPIAQSYMADIARNEKERTANLGLIGAVFGIGFIIGPALGASLSAVNPAFPFWFVGGLATLNVIGAFYFLPETHNNRDKKKKIHLNPLEPVIKAAKDSVLRSRYLAWFLFGLAFAAMQSILALYVKEVFDFSATATGYIFTATGIILFINQAFALKWLWLKRFHEADLEVWFFLMLVLGFILMDIKVLVLFSLGIFFVTLGQSTLRVVISSGAAGIAGEIRRGEVLGIMSSIMSASMAIGPLVAGILFQKHAQLPFLFNTAMLLAAFLIMRECCGKGTILREADVQTLG